MNGNENANTLGENDYSELLDHIVKRLKNIGALEVVEQLRKLEEISVIEKKSKSYGGKAAKSLPSQVSFYDPERQRNDKAWRDDMSESVSRQMTYREMYHAAVSILSSYLLSVPAMAGSIRKELLEPAGGAPLLWKTERGNRTDKTGEADGLNLIAAQDAERRRWIEQSLAVLREESSGREGDTWPPKRR